MNFDCLCFDMRQQGCSVIHVCVFLEMDKCPPRLEEAEFNHLVPNFSETEPNLNSSQRKWRQQWAGHFPLCVFNQVQTISRLKMFGRGNKVHSWGGVVHSWSQLHDSETTSTVPLYGGQPTGSCGSPAAFLIGQTCSSCCWTERRYWFSTQRTRRLHRCPMTWPTGYQIPVDLCQNAAKTTKYTHKTIWADHFFFQIITL